MTERVPGRPISVAVVDSGVCQTHPSLAECGFARGVAFSGDRHDTSDGNGHGTAVAAIIHAQAPKASVLPVRVLDSELRCRGDALAEAIEWSADNGADIINVSADTRSAARRPRLALAVRHALGLGAVVLASAGRFGAESLPAMIPGVISVAAAILASPDDRVRRRDGGPLLLGFGQSQVVPVLPTGYALHPGSSYAAARVSGIAAAHAERSGLRGEQLSAAVLASADEIGPARRSGVLLEQDLDVLQSLTAGVRVDPRIEATVIEEIARRVSGPILPESRLFEGGSPSSQALFEAIEAAAERRGVRLPLMRLGLQHVITPHAIAVIAAASPSRGLAAQANDNGRR